MTPVLIGRDHPASVLRAGVLRATESHGGLILVTGEAGMGKTTLVTEAADEARRRGALVLGGSCWDSDSAPGHWPWVQVVRGLRRGVDEETWAEAEKAAGGRLATLLGEDPGGAREGTESFPLYDAVTTALVTASQRRPLVVVLDDLHWADPASLRLLEFAAQHAWFERLLLIGTYRDVEVEAAGHPLQELILPLAARAAATVTLTGLERDEVGALIALTGGVEPEPELVDEVHRRTGGNPFFVEQTVRIWRGGGPVTTVAPGVREAVRRRIALLPAEVSGVLETAAVLGRVFHRGLLAAVAAAPVPHVDRLVERAVAARLVTVRSGGRFAFAHDLVRETLYEALDEERRSALHAAVVHAVDGTPQLGERVLPAELARHAHLAGEGVEQGRRVDLLVAAARDATSRLARDEAEGHFRRALEAAEGDQRRSVLVSLDLGDALWHKGDAEGSRHAFGRAAETALRMREPALLARVAITLHQYGRSTDEGSRDGELLREAHRALIGGSGEDLTGLSAEQIAQDLAVKTTALARSGADDEALAFSLWARHDTIWGLGTSRERLALTDEMIDVARRTGNADMALHANSMRWVTLLERGDPRYSDQLRTFSALAERSGLRRNELAMTVDQSLVAALTGRFTEAADLLSRLASEHESGLYGYVVGHMRWAMFLAQGRHREAEDLLGELEASGHPYPGLLAGLTAVERGDTALALLHTASVESLPQSPPRVFEPLAVRLRAQAAAASGDPARIEEARAALAPHSGQWIVSLFGCDIGGPVDLWLGMLDAARGDRASAQARLTAAYASADRLRARPWSVRARAELLDLLGPAAPAGLADGVLRDARELGLTHLLKGGAPGLEAVSGPGPGATSGPGAGPVSGPGVVAGPVSGPGVVAGPAGGGAAFAEAAAPHPVPASAPDSAPDSAPTAAPVSAAPSASASASASATGPAQGSPEVCEELPQPREQFRKEGAVWALAFGGRTVHMPDAKGLRDLHTLLARPGDDLSAVVLLAPGGGAEAVAARRFGGDPVLDEEAKLRYRRRLDQLDEETDRAAALGDAGRAAELDRERAALLDELRTAAGLGGRTRRLGDEAERARKTVTARIRDTLRKLGALHPELAAHLRDSVTTGAHCSYRPGEAVDWRL